MVQFINEKMHQTALVLAAGNPVMSVQVNHDKNFAFIEVLATDSLLWNVIYYKIKCFGLMGILWRLFKTENVFYITSTEHASFPVPRISPTLL